MVEKSFAWSWVNKIQLMASGKVRLGIQVTDKQGKRGNLTTNAEERKG
jgi:hypothetical protein